ncbi:PAS domain S-box protein [bacterium]|nr:PAS domain S-box protein [bacterium]
MAEETTGKVQQLRQAFDVLSKDAAWWRSLISNSPCFITIVDSDYKIVYINHVAGGARIDQVLASSIFDFIEPRFHDQARQAINSVLATGQPAVFTALIKAPDGTDAWLESNVGPVYLEDEIQAVSIISQDVTAIRRAQRDQQARKELYEHLISSMGEGLATADVNDFFIFANPAAERIFGVPEGTLVGRSINEFLTTENFKRMQNMTHIRRAGQTTNYELPITRPDGQQRVLRITGSPSFDGDGEFQGGIGIIRDITENKILEDQLRQKQKLEAIGTLAGGIAHDFNNILFTIMGNAELILETAKEYGFSHHNIKNILAASVRASKLIRQLLAFARPTRDKRRPVSLNTILDETLKMVRATLPTTVRIEKHIYAPEALVLADSTELHQVLLNLFTNANQAMTGSNGVLTVMLDCIVPDTALLESLPELTTTEYVLLSVSDNGMGMDENTMQRVFEPFFTTRDIGEGSGMGLAVVHGIVSSLDGAITVESHLGQGTTFHIYLPRCDEALWEELVPRTVTLGGTEHILLVDDDPRIVEIVKELLVLLGYQVTACTDSRKALELFKADQQAYDLVLTDQTMPDLTGAELAEQLLSLRPDLPVVLMTGYSQRLSPEEAHLKGIRDYLLKPVSKQNLAKAIRQALPEP